MGKPDKVLFQVLSGSTDQNIRFADLCALLAWLGFDLRVKGSHHVFSRSDVAEILNLQDNQGKAKPYQVKQVRDVITRYRLAGDADE